MHVQGWRGRRGNKPRDECDSGIVSEAENDLEENGRSGRTIDDHLTVIECVFRAKLIAAVNDLKNDVCSVRSELRVWKGRNTQTDIMGKVTTDWCFLYVLLRRWRENEVAEFETAILEGLLGCQVVFFL